MTIYVFGKGDDLVLPQLHPTNSSFGSEVSYTNPTYDWCYSEYGFAVPLDYEAIPYRVVMNGKFPQMSKSIKMFDTNCTYLLIDHSGDIWITSTAEQNEKKCVSPSYVYNDGSTWWVNRSSSNISFEFDFLLGLLVTDPGRDVIEQRFKSHFGNRKLNWLSIAAVTKKLNEDFPIHKEDPQENELDEKSSETLMSQLRALLPE